MNASEEIFLGIDIGGTSTKYIFTNRYGEKISGDVEKTVTTSYSDLIHQITGIIEKQKVYLPFPLKSVGVLFPGFLNFAQKRIISSPNLHILDGKPLWDDISLKIGKLPLIIENDANGAAYGEFSIRSKSDPSVKNLILLTLGTGVGGGIVIDGKIFHGNDGYGGELGHIKLFMDGRVCGCGATGCAEAYLSNYGIVQTFVEEIEKVISVEKFNKTDTNSLSAKMIADIADEGYILAKDTFRITGQRLGHLISLLINIFNPQIIAVGGGIMGADKYILPFEIEEARVKSIACAFESVKIEKAVLGSDAGAYGAAMLAVDNL